MRRPCCSDVNCSLKACRQSSAAELWQQATLSSIAFVTWLAPGHQGLLFGGKKACYFNRQYFIATVAPLDLGTVRISLLWHCATLQPVLQVVLASHGHRLTPPAGAVLTLEVQARGDYPTAVQLAFESQHAMPQYASQGSCTGSLQPGAYCIQEAFVLLLRFTLIFKALTKLKLQ